jgi:hypothetical protein
MVVIEKIIISYLLLSSHHLPIHHPIINHHPSSGAGVGIHPGFQDIYVNNSKIRET